jgi:hypothetical protein
MMPTSIQRLQTKPTTDPEPVADENRSVLYLKMAVCRNLVYTVHTVIPCPNNYANLGVENPFCPPVALFPWGLQ